MNTTDLGPKCNYTLLYAGHRDTEFPYNKVEILWPLDWLGEGVSLVDTPGVGEDNNLTALVQEAMKHCAGVIYVINTSQAGGISTDRVGTDRVGTDRVSTDSVSADRVRADRKGTDRIDTERVSEVVKE